MIRPGTLAAVAARRAERPDEPLWKPLGEFLDDFYEGGEDREGRLAQEPAVSITREEAAFLAAAAEYLSGLYGLPAPKWVGKPAYFLDVAYWPENRGRAMETICLAESPTSFRRRFIFTEGRPLRRKHGPRTGSR